MPAPATTASTVKLYHNEYSGHSHRVRLFFSLLGIRYDGISMSREEIEAKNPEYLALNPLGEVPTLVDGAVIVTDSTAALVYIAKKAHASRWLPENPAGAARVQRWLSTASGELYRGPASARAYKLRGRDLDYDAAVRASLRLFDWMQAELSARRWLAADHATIADVAMYSYIRVADEGGLDISPYPAILRWLADIEALPGFEAMPRESRR
jgi:glutathione S-transferase